MLHKENCNQLYCQLFHIVFHQIFLIRSIILRSNNLCNLKAKTCKQYLLYIIVLEIVKTNVKKWKSKRNLSASKQRKQESPYQADHKHSHFSRYFYLTQPTHSYLWENFTLSSDVTRAGYSHGLILWTFPLMMYAFCIRTFYF